MLKNNLKFTFLAFFLLFFLKTAAWGLAISSSITEGTAPLTVKFLAISTNNTGLPRFSWSTSNGLAYSNPDGRAQFTFYNTGTYTVTLSGSDSETAKTTIYVYEIQTPIPNFVISNGSVSQTTNSSSDTTGESSSTSVSSVSTAPAPFIALLDASTSSNSNGNLINYSWASSDGQSAQGINSSLIFTEPGIYTISLTITNSNLVSATTDQKIIVTQATVIANQAPLASFVASTNIGETPLIVALDAKASSDADGSIAAYQWTVDSNTNFSGINTVISLTAVGVHHIVLSVTDNDGAQAISNQDIIVLDSTDNGGIDPSVNRVPIAVFTATPSGDTDGNNIVLPLTMLFDASNSEDLDGFISQYAWTVSPLPSPSFPQPLLGEQTTIAFPTAGIFTVTLTLTDNDGASATTNQQVSVIGAVAEADVQPSVLNEAQTRSKTTLETFQLIDKSISRGVVSNSSQTLTSGILVRNSQEHFFIHAYAVDTELNPQISLLSYPELKVIENNDNWYLHQSANEIHNKGLAPSNSKDAAIIVTLTPGWYIIKVSPENTPGLGILEIKQIQLK